MRYQHKQFATAILVILTLVLVIIFCTAYGKENVATWPGLIIILVIGALFYSLNISVSDSHICWSFGPGFWRKKIHLHDVASAQIIQTPWYTGWGIRYTANGWLYRVNGDTAVQITLKSGEKLCLGTDDAENLLAAIEQINK
ncbi:hypothetical protein V1358_02530 [Pseudoalteromonas sp. YIC-656]|uniref:hypothetical protein n=1 Tax=Pseudoalteromonas pernae TaxID=3118054 RepID=UPI0032420F17